MELIVMGEADSWLNQAGTCRIEAGVHECGKQEETIVQWIEILSDAHGVSDIAGARDILAELWRIDGVTWYRTA